MKKRKQEVPMYLQIGDKSVYSVDIFGNNPPSFIFPIMKCIAKNLLSDEVSKRLSKLSIRMRRLIHPVLKSFIPLFLEYKQVFESRNNLLGVDAPDDPIDLPTLPVIWCSNHRFKDDIAASIRSARHAYILLGSLPVFFNTFSGFSAWLNGVILCNRKRKESKHAAEKACKEVLRMGTDLIIFPEGTWNKCPEKLLLDFWPGVYRIAAETNTPIVPVIHYLADPQTKYPGNVIHTVIAEPIQMDGLSEKEGLELLRNTMATWYFLMMERYGQSTRQEALCGFNTAAKAWEDFLSVHTGSIQYYDREIECAADYLSKDKIRPHDVWEPIVKSVKMKSCNVSDIIYATNLLEEEFERCVQRRF